MVRLFLVLAALVPAATARAEGCASDSSGPAVTDAASWKRYRSWCAACGGTVPENFNAAAAQGGCRLPPSPGASGAPAAAGHQLDGHITDAISAGMSGRISGLDAAGLVGMGVLGNALLAPKARNPAQEAAQAAREAERLRLLEADSSRRADALLAEMLDTGEPAGEEPAFLADGQPRLKPRAGDRAVLEPPSDQAAAPSLLDEMMLGPGPGTPKAGAPAAKSDAFSRGLAHGLGCFSQSAGPTCAGAAPGGTASCLDDYRRGYHEGDKAAKERLASAYRAGARDRAAGAGSNGASQADAAGECRIPAVQAYNSGYSGAPRP